MVMERQHAPNIGNDDVHALRQFRLARVTLEKLDAVWEAVRGRELPRELNTVIGLDGENAPRSRSTCKQGKDAGTATDFRDGLDGTHRSRKPLGECADASGVTDH